MIGNINWSPPMKKLILLSALISNVYAFECTKNETQIIGKGKVVSLTNGKCLAKLESVRDYKPSILCPILLDEIKDSLISLNDIQCEDVQNDGVISGVLVTEENSGILTLEN